MATFFRFKSIMKEMPRGSRMTHKSAPLRKGQFNWYPLIIVSLISEERMMVGFKVHKHAEARRHSASQLIKLLLQEDPAILRVHRAEAMSVALWKFTEADGKHNTPYCSQRALAAPKAERIHEHVFQRALMINELLKSPQDVDKILQQAHGCLVTRQEHALLENYKHLYGWER
jgi:hypothetical protein